MPKQKPQACIHRWELDAPDGPTSKGRCRLCGAEREFRNALPGPWDKGEPRPPTLAPRSALPPTPVDGETE